MKHHLDDLIKKMEHDDDNIDSFEIILLLLKEIKRIDEAHEALIDWVHDYDA